MNRMAIITMWKHLSNPKHILNLTVVMVCLSVACYQLSGCFRKLLSPPVLTHYDFGLNETLNFPAVTVCRSSPYKSDVYEQYGLGVGGPGKTISWKTFDFYNYTVQEFFDEATYDLEEVLPFYGFDTLDENVDVTSFYRLYYGRCFTITPKNETTKWDSDGYFLYLTHTVDEPAANGYDISIPGFHIYIHDRKEVFTGVVR